MPSNLRHLPGTELTADVVLRRALDESEEIESVLVMWYDADGIVHTSWSNMSTSKLALLAVLLHDDAVRAAAEVD